MIKLERSQWTLEEIAVIQNYRGQPVVIRRKPFLRRYWSSYRGWRRLGYPLLTSLRNAWTIARS